MVSKARSKRNSGLVYGFFAMCGLSPEFFSSLTLLSVIRGRPGAVHPHCNIFSTRLPPNQSQRRCLSCCHK